MVRNILRLENLLIFLVSLYSYSLTQASWLMFVLLWIAPDISLAGYLKNNNWGRIVYNLGHNYLVATGIIVYGLSTANELFLACGLIYLSHVSLDRFLGFGLKYERDFKQTHIQRV